MNTPSYPVSRHPADCPWCDGYDLSCLYTRPTTVPPGELAADDCPTVLASAGLCIVDGEVCFACHGTGVLTGECVGGEEDERWEGEEACEACAPEADAEAVLHAA